MVDRPRGIVSILGRMARSSAIDTALVVACLASAAVAGAGETRTLSIAIFDAVQVLDHASANRTALFLLAVSFAVLTLTYALQRRAGTGWPTRS
jgi:ABC-type molybdate transport system permease subunit